MKLKDFKMVKDENTAYDEVIEDINALNHGYVKTKGARILITKKLKQLMRLLNDNDNELE